MSKANADSSHKVGKKYFGLAYYVFKGRYSHAVANANYAGKGLEEENDKMPCCPLHVQPHHAWIWARGIEK